MSRIAVVGGHGQIARLLHPILMDAGTPRWPSCAGPSRPELAARASGPGCSTSSATRPASPPPSRVRRRGLRRRWWPRRQHRAQAHRRPRGRPEVDRGAGRLGSAASSRSQRSTSTSQLPDDAEPVWPAYVEAKRDADTALRASGLDWTIVRPGRLTDDSAHRAGRAGGRVARGRDPRADVAAVLAEVVDDERGHRPQWNLVSGDTPVADEVARVGS